MRKNLSLLLMTILFTASSLLADDWSPTPMVIDVQDVVEYDFDGDDLEIPFSLSGKAGKIWLVVESMLPDEEKPVAVMNGFKGWHFVNGIDTTVYVSTGRDYAISTNNIFPWDGTGNEKGIEDGWYDQMGSSGPLPEGTYRYYLWGFDFQSSRELVCDFLPIGNFWEGQFLRFYPYDDTGALYDTPMLMGQVPYFLTHDSLGDEILDRIGNATICKWKLGSDPLNADLLETSAVTGFGPAEQMPGYGAGVFDPQDHNTFYFAKNQYWDQTQTVVKYQYAANSEAVQDMSWGDYSHVSWAHPGVNGDNTKHSVLYNLGDTYLVMLDGGTNPMETQHDRLRVLSKSNPEDELFDIQLDEFYMPLQPDDPETGDSRTSSELNRLAPGRREGTFYITGEFTCLTELVDVSRLIDAGGNLDPYSPDGSGYVIWANSNGDFFLDMSAYPDPERPEQLWACIVTDPKSFNNPRRELSPADMYGFQVAYTEFTSSYECGIYCPDGSGIELLSLGEDYSSTCDYHGFQGNGEVLDNGGQYDGLYINKIIWCGMASYDPRYLKTYWRAFDSDSGIITNDPDGLSVTENNHDAFSVAQNSPNPFNPTTTISFNLAEAGQVSVEVYNVAGQKVYTLVNEFMTVGNHTVVWDASGCAAGVYFYTIKAGEYTRTMKMTLVK